jgi:hypothetical protein
MRLAPHPSPTPSPTAAWTAFDPHLERWCKIYMPLLKAQEGAPGSHLLAELVCSQQLRESEAWARTYVRTVSC